MSIEIIKVTKKQEIEVEEILINYSTKAIEQLIRNDLLGKGYETDQILFKTNYRHKTDEWGMNQRIVSYFQGVDVVAKEKTPEEKAKWAEYKNAAENDWR